MVTRYLIDCNCAHPGWPFIPLDVPCGSARTVGVIGLQSRDGVEVSGCKIQITNADGVAMMKDCVKEGAVWVVTFPASHFQSYGKVKNGVVIYAVGQDERGEDQLWIERVGDLRVTALDASSAPGGETVTPAEVFLKSEIVDGVQHYKREVLTYSERQRAWGAEYVGDYIFVGGVFVSFGEG